MNSALLDTLGKFVAPLKTRVANMVARAVLRVADDAKKIQIVQVDLLDGETRDDLERFQNYGFTSAPSEGAEAVVLFVGGRRDHGLAIAVDDRRYRFMNLQDGEVAVYNRFGASIVLKASGEIEVTPKTGEVLRIAGSLEVQGDIDSTGTVTGSTDVVGGGKSLKLHTHSATLTVAGTSPSGPVTGTATGSTGAPT